MTTADDAVEAGARALNDHDTWSGIEDGAECECGLLLAGDVETYAHPIWKTHRAREATRAMWPILSAGLRELHRQKINFRPRRLDGGAHLREECQHCGPRVDWPCATVRELDRIDKELGL